MSDAYVQLAFDGLPPQWVCPVCKQHGDGTLNKVTEKARTHVCPGPPKPVRVHHYRRKGVW